MFVLEGAAIDFGAESEVEVDEGTSQAAGDVFLDGEPMRAVKMNRESHISIGGGRPCVRDKERVFDDFVFEVLNGAWQVCVRRDFFPGESRWFGNAGSTRGRAGK